jgi:hypothetical protein
MVEDGDSPAFCGVERTDAGAIGVIDDEAPPREAKFTSRTSGK